MKIVSLEEAASNGLKRFFTGVPCDRGHISERYVRKSICVQCCRERNTAYVSKRFAEDEQFRQKRISVATNFRYQHPERSKEYDARHAKKNPNRAKQKAQNTRTWLVNNIQRKRDQQKKWAAKSPDKLRKYRIKDYEKNSEVRKEAANIYRTNNPEKVRAAIKRWLSANPHAARAYNLNRRTKEKKNGGHATKQDIKALFERQNAQCAACPNGGPLEIDHIMPVCLGGSSDPQNLQLLCGPCNRSKGGKHPDEWEKIVKLRSPHYSKFGLRSQF